MSWTCPECNVKLKSKGFHMKKHANKSLATEDVESVLISVSKIETPYYSNPEEIKNILSFQSDCICGGKCKCEENTEDKTESLSETISKLIPAIIDNCKEFCPNKIGKLKKERAIEIVVHYRCNLCNKLISYRPLENKFTFVS